MQRIIFIGIFLQMNGGIISRLFFIHFVAPHALALHLAVKILLQIFLYERFEHVKPFCTSVGCISLQECQQDRTLLRSQYY